MQLRTVQPHELLEGEDAAEPRPADERLGIELAPRNCGGSSGLRCAGHRPIVGVRREKVPKTFLNPVRVLVAPDAEHREAAEDDDGEECDQCPAVGPVEPGDYQVGDDQ